MVSVYDIKPQFQKLLQPVMRSLARHKVTPNMVTTAAFLGSLAAGTLLVLRSGSFTILWILPAWLFLRMALNAIDGMMARQMGQASALGAVLNEAGDVLSDIFLYMPLVVFVWKAVGAIVVFVLIAVLTEFCGVLGQALGARRFYDGPMGKSDRAFFIGALALATAVAPQVAAWWRPLFFLAGSLGILTCWNRLRHTLRYLKEKEVS